jgi:hypothetical protein
MSFAAFPRRTTPFSQVAGRLASCYTSSVVTKCDATKALSSAKDVVMNFWGNFPERSSFPLLGTAHGTSYTVKDGS